MVDEPKPVFAPGKVADLSCDGNEPWEIQSGETSRAFAAFKIYRDLGRSRSLPEAARALGVFHSVVRKWSYLRKWVERSKAWDVHCDEEDRRAMAKKRIETRDQEYVKGDRLVVVGSAGLEKIAECIDDGKLVAPADVVNMMKTGFAMKRQAVGEPDQVIQTEGRSLQVSVDLGAIDMAEVAAILRESRGLDMIPGASAQLPQPNGNGHAHPGSDPGNGNGQPHD